MPVLPRIELRASDRRGKKLVAEFVSPATGRVRRVHFGAAGYEDYTTHKDPARKARYIARHRARENFADIYTPGALARFILWNLPSLRASARDAGRRFRVRFVLRH